MTKKAYLAGGCFCGLEELFRKQKGILNIDAGYTGGKEMMDSTGSPQAPTYESHDGYTCHAIYFDSYL